MGDRREAGDGLHKWGLVPIERIEGRVELIWLSMGWIGDSALSRPTMDAAGIRTERMLSWVH
jgi:hypothetical protein